MDKAILEKEVKEMIKKLPEDATWDDLMHSIYVRQAVEAGLEDSKAGRVTHVNDVRKEFGLLD